MSKKEYKMNPTPIWVWIIVGILGIFSLIVIYAMADIYIFSKEEYGSNGFVEDIIEELAENSNNQQNDVGSNSDDQEDVDENEMNDKDEDEGLVIESNKPNVFNDEAIQAKMEDMILSTLQEDFEGIAIVEFIPLTKTYIIAPYDEDVIYGIDQYLKYGQNQETWNELINITKVFSLKLLEDLGPDYRVAFLHSSTNREVLILARDGVILETY